MLPAGGYSLPRDIFCNLGIFSGLSAEKTSPVNESKKQNLNH